MFFAGIGIASVAFLSARRRIRPSEVALLLGLGRNGVGLVAVGSVLVLSFGLWLVDLGGHSLGDVWVAAALFLFIAALVLGALGGRRPRRARLTAARLAREGDTPGDEVRVLLADPASLALDVAATAAAAAVLVLMIWQPGG